MTTRDGRPTMTTYTGKVFDFTDPKPEMICIEDIAHALALECRFQNQCREHYSVAQHSVLVSKLVQPDETRWFRNERLLRKVALMHDAAEAYLGDLAKPLKRLLQDYKLIERTVHIAICIKFHLPTEDVPECVKDIDRRILANEGRALMPSGWNDAMHDYDPGLIEVTPCHAGAAEDMFLARYRELFGD